MSQPNETNSTTISGQSSKQPESSPINDDISSTASTNEDQDRFQRQSIPTPEKSYRLSKSLIFAPYGDGPYLNIKPGGENGKIRTFKLSTQVVSRMRKVGPRKSFTIEQFLKLRKKFYKFPKSWNDKVIEGVFDDGLGIDLGEEIVDAPIISTSSPVKNITKDTKENDKKAFKNIQEILGKRSTNNGNLNKPNGKTPNAKTAKAVRQNKNIASRKPTKYEKKTDIDVVNDKKEDRSRKIEARVVTGALSKHTRGWKPNVLKKEKNSGVRIDPMVAFSRKVLLVLNKITLDNFPTLAAQLHRIFDVDITKTEHLEKLVSEIFQKTVQEHKYGPLYSKLCVELSKKERKFELYYPNKDGSKMLKKEVDFRRILLLQCQKEFDKGSVAAKITDDMTETEKRNAQIKQKKILMGTMKFIGQLFIDELLPSKAIDICLSKLVGNKANPKEVDIECACNLLSTVGYKLDGNKSSGIQMNNYYKKLTMLSKHNKYGARIKILIKNLLDSKSKNWKDEILKRKLKTVEDVRNEWKQEHNGLLPSDLVKGNQGDKWDVDMLPLLKGNIGAFMGANDYDTNQLISSSLVNTGNVNKRKQRKERYGNVNLMSDSPNKNINGKKSTKNKSKLLTLTYIDDEEEEEKEIIEQPSIKVSKITKKDVPSGARYIRDDIASKIDQTKQPLPLSSDKEFYQKYTHNYMSPQSMKEKWTIDEFISWLNMQLKTFRIDNKINFIDVILEKCLYSFSETYAEKTLKVFSKLMNNYIITFDDFDKWGAQTFEDFSSNYNDIKDGVANLLSELIFERELDFLTLSNWVKIWMKTDKENNTREKSELTKAENELKNCTDKNKISDLEFDVKRLKARTSKYIKMSQYYGEFMATILKYINDNGKYGDYPTTCDECIKNTNFNIKPFLINMSVNDWKKKYKLQKIYKKD